MSQPSTAHGGDSRMTPNGTDTEPTDDENSDDEQEEGMHTPRDSAIHSRLVAALECGVRTFKRAVWGNWRVEVVDQYVLSVTNASYPRDEWAAHSYNVTLVVTDDGLVPGDCTCPADKYNDEDCKHKLALAWEGTTDLFEQAKTGPRAANGHDTAPDGGPRVETATLAEKLGYGGGD